MFSNTLNPSSFRRTRRQVLHQYKQVGVQLREGRPESKDRLAIKKNKQKKIKKLIHHYYRP
jgi:hypothetical protein